MTSAPPTVPSRCLQPGLSGDGEEYLARYFYSPEYRQCLHFIYSGKGGNENNFETQQDCIETCIANGVKFSCEIESFIFFNHDSALASTVPQPTFSFAFMPAPICPQGTALLDANNDPLSCQISQVSGSVYLNDFYFSALMDMFAQLWVPNNSAVLLQVFSLPHYSRIRNG